MTSKQNAKLDTPHSIYRYTPHRYEWSQKWNPSLNDMDNATYRTLYGRVWHFDQVHVQSNLVKSRDTQNLLIHIGVEVKLHFVSFLYAFLTFLKLLFRAHFPFPLEGISRHEYVRWTASIVHPNILELLLPHRVESRHCNRTAYALCIAYQPHVYHTLTYANRWNYKYTRHGTTHKAKVTSKIHFYCYTHHSQRLHPTLLLCVAFVGYVCGLLDTKHQIE